MRRHTDSRTQARRILMRLLVILSLILIPTHAVAITDKELVARCRDAGFAKIAAQAAEWRCQLTGQISVDHIDSRPWNPSKYIWFTVPVHKCSNDQTSIKKLVQYYLGSCY